MATTTRNELKQYFQKGKIPTQAHFEALIDSGLNQLDDRLRSSPNDPLTLLPSGAGGGLLAFSRVETNAGVETLKTTWLIRDEPNGAAVGLLFQDGAGKVALCLQGGTGYLGVGTNQPGAQLEVKASGKTWSGWFEAIRFSQAEHSAITHPASGLLFGLHGNRRFYFADTTKAGAEGYLLTIDANTRNVGIGTANPDRPLTLQPPASSAEWLSLKDATGQTRWHLNHLANGFNLAETVLTSRVRPGIGPGGGLPSGGFGAGHDDDGWGGTVVVHEPVVHDGRFFVATGGDVGIGTPTPKARLQVVGGAIMPAAGDREAGIEWPPDPFTGSGDRAWIRYHNQRGGEKGTLEIGIANDHDDHIILKPSGNVGIGTTDPASKLQVVNGRVDLTSSPTDALGGVRFDGLAAELRRAQLVLTSEYSDLVIASSQMNQRHGSTLTFATFKPGDATSYHKWVINQGNWADQDPRMGFLEFGYSAQTANPHASISDASTVLTLDGVNKRVGIGTTSPEANLHVAGSATVGSLTVNQPYFVRRAAQFKLEGAQDRFYPVVFRDEGWADGALVIEITRSNVHWDKQWYGALVAMFTCHSGNYGHGAAFLQARVQQQRTRFIADFRNAVYSPDFVVWLRGGTTYSWRTNQAATANTAATEKTLGNNEKFPVQAAIQAHYDKDFYTE